MIMPRTDDPATIPTAKRGVSSNFNISGTDILENTEALAIAAPVIAAKPELAPTVAKPMPPVIRWKPGFITA